MDSKRLRAALAALLAAGAAAAGIAVTSADDDEAPPQTTTAPTAEIEAEASGGAYVPAPDEAAGIAESLAAIESGGPPPYEEDGGVFENREGLLPDRPLGYYREYTVETPGSHDRGARRLVIGEGGEVFYTADHYASFHQIDPEGFR